MFIMLQNKLNYLIRKLLLELNMRIKIQHDNLKVFVVYQYKVYNCIIVVKIRIDNILFTEETSGFAIHHVL